MQDVESTFALLKEKSNLDLRNEMWLQAAESAAQNDAEWRTLITIGAGLVVALVFAAFIMAAYWFTKERHRSPPPPKSIIPQQRDRWQRYNTTKHADSEIHEHATHLSCLDRDRGVPDIDGRSGERGR